MKIGISASTFQTKFGPVVFSGSNIIDNLRIIKNLCYDGIDLFIHQMKELEFEMLMNTIKSLELEVALMVPIFLAEQGVNLSDPNIKKRIDSIGKYKKQIELASQLRANMPIGFIRGNRQENEDRESYDKRLAESLLDLSEFARSHNVRLLLEPMNRYEINTFLRVDESLDFINKYNLNQIGLLLDTFHMNIEEASIEKAVELAKGKIGHVHITDSNRLAPGYGHLDYNAIISAIRGTGYDGFLTIEAFPTPSAFECAKKGIDFLKKLI